MPMVKRMFTITVSLDEYDNCKLLVLCRKHHISEDEMISQLIDLAAALAFNDDELQEFYKEEF